MKAENAKRKSYRERYFELHQAVKAPARDGKGSRTVYRYTGQWKAWTPASLPLSGMKLLMACFEIISILLFAWANLSDVGLNRSRFTAGFGILSLAAWLPELSGVVRFICHRAPVTELCYGEIDQAIRAGCVLRAALVFASVLSGGADLLLHHSMALADIPVGLAVLVSAALSLLVWRCYGRLSVDTLSNEDGQPRKNNLKIQLK